jgi:hypothetical protein
MVLGMNFPLNLWMMTMYNRKCRGGKKHDWWRSDNTAEWWMTVSHTGARYHVICNRCQVWCKHKTVPGHEKFQGSISLLYKWLPPVGGELEIKKERGGRRKRTILICFIFRALIRYTNCIIDQQMHFNSNDVILLLYGHQYVSTTQVTIFRAISLRTRIKL